MSSLKEKYFTDVFAALKSSGAYANAMMVPRIKKVVVNMGFGIVDKDAQKALVADLAAVTGQQPSLRRARMSISNFKLRQGMVVGAKVTLRGDRMYEFIGRLVDAALPRIRDFRGISPGGFDGKGNYTMGISDQSIFPEIDPNRVAQEQGMDITIVTSAASDGPALELLKLLGFPFAEK